MKKTYKEFLESFDKYADGAEIAPSFHDYNENKELYIRAEDEGYIMIGIGYMGFPRIIIIKHFVTLRTCDLNCFICKSPTFIICMQEIKSTKISCRSSKRSCYKKRGCTNLI